MNEPQPPVTRRDELRLFLLLLLVAAPLLAVMVVGGYGFSVWMFQILTGRLPTG